MSGRSFLPKTEKDIRITGNITAFIAAFATGYFGSPLWFTVVVGVIASLLVQTILIYYAKLDR